MTHPAIVRQQARVSAATETTQALVPKYYQHDPTKSGTSGYGAARRAVIIHLEGAAGANAGINQIATQDPDMIETLNEAIKEGIVSSLGALI